MDDTLHPVEWIITFIFVVLMLAGGIFGMLAGAGKVSAPEWSPIGTAQHAEKG